MHPGWSARTRCLLNAVLCGAVAAGFFISAPAGGRPAQPAGFMRSELVFPLDPLHNHGSCIIQCPNGDLLVCWYRGSGERTADDVRILGARRRTAWKEWSEPFPMADASGFPDCNPAMVVDPQRRLWLFWPTILANEWHTALLMSKVAHEYQRAGQPEWVREKLILLKPGPEFAGTVSRSVEEDLKRLQTLPVELRDRARQYLERRRTNAADKYFNRMGWMPRAHPFILDRRRLILPLYSDGFDFSLMAYTDDWGETWKTGPPLVGDGPIQPSIALKKDGTLATYMRDNGRAPKRLLYSESADGGVTWAPVRDTTLPNPGSGAEVVGLANGHWALVYNNTEVGRHRLAVSISDDDGKSWRWTRHLERDADPLTGGSYSYPSIIQAKDGTLHVTYSLRIRAGGERKLPDGTTGRASIKHAHFDEAWVQAGD